MKALIVEDEVMAANMLARTLTGNFPDIEVVGITDSVRGTVEWLGSHASPDVIFMDVELSDGECFEIFRQTQVKSQIIMTTAYDTYAVKAFETGSIDYLLKPIALEALTRAVTRCRERVADNDIEAVLKVLADKAGNRPPPLQEPLDSAPRRQDHPRGHRRHRVFPVGGQVQQSRARRRRPLYNRLHDGHARTSA